MIVVQLWEGLAERVGNVLKDFPTLNLTHGRKVLEVHPSIEWDKGKAVDFLLNSLGKELHRNRRTSAWFSFLLENNVSNVTYATTIVRFLESLTFKFAGFKDTSDVLPLYLGDDKTDEDAFKVGHMF